MTVEVGQAAPDFTLKDQAGNDVSLSDYKGKQPVVLVFYPFTFTGVCQGELCEIRDDPSTFESAGRRGARDLLRHPPRAGAVGRAAGLHVPRPLGLLAPRRGRQGLRRVQRAARLREPRQFVIDKDGMVVGEVRVGEPRVAPRSREEYEAGTGEGDMKFSDMLGKRDPRARPRSPSRSSRPRPHRAAGARGPISVFGEPHRARRRRRRRRRSRIRRRRARRPRPRSLRAAAAATTSRSHPSPAAADAVRAELAGRPRPARQRRPASRSTRARGATASPIVDDQLPIGLRPRSSSDLLAVGIDAIAENCSARRAAARQAAPVDPSASRTGSRRRAR